MAFQVIHDFDWNTCNREEFVKALAHLFPPVWQVHPFREGNTRSVVMLMTLFVEAHGYFVDKELLVASAGYVRDSLVMASIDQFSEFEHLERILFDAVCVKPLESSIEDVIVEDTQSKYQKYQKESYTPVPHMAREDD